MDQIQIVRIPIDQLHDSPFNPRRTFSGKTLDELAEDIKHQGVLSPLLVRPRVPPLFRGVDDADAQVGFELVFGHRRLRASQRAGLTVLPCMVKSLTDDEARRAQISENLSREDVHPIEEGEGYRALIDDGTETADSLAERYGKSRSHVYGRLKLLQLCPEVRKAVLDREVDTEVGLLIARVGPPKLQVKALAAIKAKYWSLDDGGKKSYRNIRELLVDKFTLDLGTAIFDIEDEGLLLSAGHCMRCHKRSGNDPTFEDVTRGDGCRQYGRTNHGPNVCTDPDCFEAKKRAHLAREAAKLEADGKTVAAGNKARAAVDACGQLKGDYVAATDVRKAAKSAGVKGKLPEVLVVQDPRSGQCIEVMRRSEVAQATPVKLAEPAPARRSAWGRSPEEQERMRLREEQERMRLREEQERMRLREEQEQAEIKAVKAQRLDMLQAVRAKIASTERDTDDLRMLAHAMVDDASGDNVALVSTLWGADLGDGDDEPTDYLRQRVNALPPGDLARLMMDLVLANNVTPTYHWDIRREPEELLATARRYGIDPGSTPPTAARAQEETAAAAGAAEIDAAAGAGAGDEADWQPERAGAAGPGQMDDAGSAGDEQMDEAGGDAAGRQVLPVDAEVTA